MVTLKLIAQQLGVSKSTVSRALKNHPRIGIKTKEKVQALARRLDYVPSEMAINFKKKQTKLIGVIVPDIAMHFYGKIVSGITDFVTAQGYHVALCQTHDDAQIEYQQIIQLTKMGVDGFVLALAKTSVHTKLFKNLREKYYPFVFVDRHIEGYSAVYSDDIQGAYVLTAYLLDQKYTSLCMINGPQRLHNAQLRENGFKQAILQRHNPAIKYQIIYTALDIESNTEAFATLCHTQPDVQAIFCYNDYLAHDCLIYLRQHPHIQARVAGYGFEPVSQLHVPPILTVDQNPYALGMQAATLILKHIVHCNNEIETAFTTTQIKHD